MLGSGLVRTMFGITDVTRSRHVGPLPLLTADGFTHLKSEEVYFLTLSRDAREEDKVELNQNTCECSSVESDSLYSFCALPEYWCCLWLCPLLGKAAVSQTGSIPGRLLSLPELFWGFIPFHTGWWWESDAPLQLAITWCLSSQRMSNMWVYRLQRDHSPTTGRQYPLNRAQQHFPTTGDEG